jgi:hypothetical protein
VDFRKRAVDDELARQAKERESAAQAAAEEQRQLVREQISVESAERARCVCVCGRCGRYSNVYLLC